MGALANYPSLRDRCVFITGGATGIGAAIVKAFAQQGAKVAFVDVDADSATNLIAVLESESLTQLWFQEVDVTDSEIGRASCRERV